MNADVSQLASRRWGHFDLATGFHGDLWLDLDALFLWPDRLRPGAGQLAGQLRQYQPAAVCGPLAGGAFLAQMVAESLGAAFLPASPAPGPGHPVRYRLPVTVRDRIGGWRVAIVDDAVNAGTAVVASCREIRDAGAVPVAVAALFALGRSGTVITGTLGLPFHALTTMASSVWPAGRCPLCENGTPLERPATDLLPGRGSAARSSRRPGRR
jgi:orotate phosphoribosyltransferase